MGDEQKGVPQSVEEMTGDFPGRKRQELPPELQPKSKMEYKPTMGGWQGFNIPEGQGDKIRLPLLELLPKQQLGDIFSMLPEPEEGQDAPEYIEGLWEKYGIEPPAEASSLAEMRARLAEAISKSYLKR